LRYDHISSPFDPRRLHPILRRIQPHNGIDFSAPTGTPVWAAAAGTVTWAGPKGPNGNLVAITHGGGYQSFYAHLHRIQPGITRGAHVNQRQPIGQVGTTGRSTGPHLHFGLKRGNQFVDPAAVLNGPGRQLSPGPLAQFRRHSRTLARELSDTPLAPARVTTAQASSAHP
jgi:murein DD-endopeptidase MepM/ murein hydrolase activator NlpD